MTNPWINVPREKLESIVREWTNNPKCYYKGKMRTAYSSQITQIEEALKIKASGGE